MKRASVEELLELLRRETESTARAARPQPVGKLPTLAAGRARAASPQLAARFGFAGRWQDVVLGSTWLAIKDMAPSRASATPPARRRRSSASRRSCGRRSATS